jgi:hypothetical protein
MQWLIMQIKCRAHHHIIYSMKPVPNCKILAVRNFLATGRKVKGKLLEILSITFYFGITDAFSLGTAFNLSFFAYLTILGSFQQTG